MNLSPIARAMHIAFFAASGLGALHIQPAAAQTSDAPAAPTEPAADTRKLETVEITAQRRKERLQDVPIAVTAIGEGELEKQGAKNFEDAARSIPGLVFVPGALGGAGAPIIRGVSSQVGAATVGYYIDDVPVQVRPQNFSGNPDPKLFDIERLEVLRGPQGTLFGSSSMGGTIRFITPRPDFRSWSFRTREELAWQDDGRPNYELALAGGGPVNETLAVRASALVRRDGGFIDRVSRTNGDVLANDINDNDTAAVKVAAELRPTANLRILPQVFYQRIKKDDYNTFEPNRPGIQTSSVTPQRGNDSFVLPSLTIEYDLSGATLTSVTSKFKRTDKQLLDYSTYLPNAFFKRDFVPGFENYSAFSDNAIRQDVFAQELRLTSNASGPFKWLVGGFYRRSKETFDQYVSDNTIDSVTQALLNKPASALLGPFLPNNGIFSGTTTSTETQSALFGDATYAFTQKLSASAGVRLSRSQLDYVRDTDGPANGGHSLVTGTQKETPVTPRAVLNYKPDDTTLLYTSLTRGFRVGGVNTAVPATRCAADIAALGGNPPPSNFNADSLWSYEAGAKYRSADRKWTANAAVYQIDWNNIQQLLSLPGCGFSYTDNLGKAKIRGAELEIGARPIPAVTLGLRAAYTDARFSEDVFSAPNPSTGARTTIAKTGDRVLGIPQWTYSLSAEYRFAIADMDAFVRTDQQFVGSAFRTLPPGRAGYTAAIYEFDSYHVSNARLGINLRGWDLALFGTNLMNERPTLGASTNLSPAAQTVRGTTLRPRTLGVTVSKDF